MKPFYEQSGMTIYHGDCREVIEQWEGQHGLKSFDLLLTDPPYGIGEARGKNASRSKLAIAVDYGTSEWDDKTADDVMPRLRSIARDQIIFGGNYYALPPASCWLVWDKDNGENDFADCELAWTNLKKAVRRLRYRWAGMLQEPGCQRDVRQHPTQKPEAVMRWCLSLVTNVHTVLDPFMGSGTTLVAAKRLGKTAVGIEREEKYCEIAAQRLAQESLFSAEAI